jgi:hypothetical protein
VWLAVMILSCGGARDDSGRKQVASIALSRRHHPLHALEFTLVTGVTGIEDSVQSRPTMVMKSWSSAVVDDACDFPFPFDRIRKTAFERDPSRKIYFGQAQDGRENAHEAR